MKRTLTSLTVGAILAKIAAARSAHPEPIGAPPTKAVNFSSKPATPDEGTAFKAVMKAPI